MKDENPEVTFPVFNNLLNSRNRDWRIHRISAISWLRLVTSSLWKTA